MKQAAAIFLLGIFSFNIFGYRIVADYLSHKADINLESSLDKEDYDEAELITIKEPTRLPYYTNSKNFQRADGEVIKGGTIYRYVKCRIYNDSLEMLCIPHTAKMQIQNSKEAFFKLANDLQQDNGKKKSAPEQKQVKSMVSEYEEIQNIQTDLSFTIVTNSFFNNIAALPQTFIKTSKRPPDYFFNALAV